MHVEIIDDKFGEDNFEYDVYVNGDKVEKNPRERKIALEAVSEEDIIEVKAKNIILSSRFGWAFMVLFWILSLLTGTGEPNPFGKPFDAYIKFRAKSVNIRLRGKRIWDKEAFEIFEGKAEVIENTFLSTRQQRRRWCMGMVLPLDIIIGALFVMFICLATTLWLGVVLAVCIGIVGLCWNSYAYRVLRALKKNSRVVE